MATGTLILRPSADISVEHFLYPANSDVPAYQRINEEVSDGESLYIRTNSIGGIEIATSKFKLSNTTQLNKSFIITSVSIMGDPIGTGTEKTAKNEFRLEINGVETESFLAETGKDIDISVSVPGVIDSINEYVATHETLPNINIIITSYIVPSNKSSSDSGVSQIYVAMGYEEITDIGIHKKINGTWVAATAAYQKVNGAWVEITEDEAKSILQSSFCTK